MPEISNKYTFGRVAFDIALFGSALFAPFWLTVILAVLGTLVFERFFEVIILGVVIDALYAPTFSGAFSATMTLSALLLYGIVTYIRPRLRAYA